MNKPGQDVRFALRGFRRTPAFFSTAATILAPGIGMSVAMFTGFCAVLDHPLPVVDQDRVAVLWTYANDSSVDVAGARTDVLRGAAVVTAGGAVAGLVVAWDTSHLLGSLLFQASPIDPLARGGACAVLLIVGAAAAYLPARRATHIDPVQALRAN